MSKELRELLQSLEKKKAKVRNLIAEDKVTEAENMMEEVRALQKKVSMQQELEASEAFNLDDATPINNVERDLEAEYKRVFLKGLRRQRITADDYSIINDINLVLSMKVE